MGKYRKTQVKQKLKRKSHKSQKKLRESISNTRNTDANIFGLLHKFKRAVEQLNHNVKKLPKIKLNKLSEYQSAIDEFETSDQSLLPRNHSRKSGKRPARKRTVRNSRVRSESVDSLKCHRCRLLREMDVMKPAPESVEQRNVPSSTESINGALPLTTGPSTRDGSTAALPISSAKSLIIARTASNTLKPDQVVTECDEGLMLSEFQRATPDPQQYQNNFLNALNTFYQMCQQVDQNSSLENGELTLFASGDAISVQSSFILGERSTDDTHRNSWSQDEDEDYKD
ncbi:GH10672 [Drosophila grimshawi]|uniref:GH10672 n=1 Tax=Drosophila grimshawi TaxID=7222 RepID=B4JCF3_DROGR|nr:GH10672 [Drosophila grimshawi]